MDAVAEVYIPDAPGAVHHLGAAGATRARVAGKILLADVGLRFDDHPGIGALRVETPHQMFAEQPARECNRFFLPE
jgi:hypothetical protein